MLVKSRKLKTKQSPKSKNEIPNTFNEFALKKNITIVFNFQK